MAKAPSFGNSQYVPQMTPDMQNYIQQNAQSVGIPAPPTSPFMGNGSPFSQAVGNGLMFLSNFNQPNGVTTAGNNIASVARGLIGGQMMRRQMQYQQAMFPFQMAQQVLQMRQMMAPQAIKTDYGIVQRNPITGSLNPALSNFDIAKMNTGIAGAPDTTQAVMNMLPPDADPDTKRRAQALVQTAGMMPDPMKRLQYINDGMKNIFDDIRQRREFAITDARQKQYEQGMLQMRDIMAQNSKMFAQAALGNLAMRENDFTNQYTPESKKTMEDSDMLYRTLDDLEQRITPIAKANGNHWPLSFAGDMAKYSMGVAPTSGPLAGIGAAEAARTQVLGGANWMRSAGSRNTFIYQQAQQHIFNPMLDSPLNALQKIRGLKDSARLTAEEAAQRGLEHYANGRPPFAWESQPTTTLGQTPEAGNQGTGNGLSVPNDGGSGMYPYGQILPGQQPSNVAPMPMVAPRPKAKAASALAPKPRGNKVGGLNIIRDAQGNITGVE